MRYSDATNIDEVPLPKLPTARGFVVLFEKIYDGGLIIPSFKYRGGCTIPLFQLSV
jgi:hypothetical protein